MVDTILFLLEFTNAVSLCLRKLLFFALLVDRVGGQARFIELSVNAILVLREDFEPVGTRSRLLFEFKLLLRAFGLFRSICLIQFLLSLGQ